MQNFFIVVPVYNGAKWIEKCLNSIQAQDYLNYRVIIISDHSSDNTWELIQKYPFEKYRNRVHKGSVAENIIKAVQIGKPGLDDIIMVVDGDDWLKDNSVLSYLNSIYSDRIWFTYGQFEPVSGGYSDFCKPILNTGTYRKEEEWTIGQLRTWRKWLWDLIDNVDLRDSSGNYFDAACDRAFAYPMIEMAGPEHIKLIEKVIYVYNDLNPLCGFRLRPDECLRNAEYIKNKPEYKRL